MSKKYKIDTDKGSFLVETDEPDSPRPGMLDPKTALETNLPEVTPGTLARDYSLGIFQGLGGDLNSPIVGTAKNALHGLYGLATNPTGTGRALVQQYANLPNAIRNATARGEQGQAAEEIGQATAPVAMAAGGVPDAMRALGLGDPLMTGAAGLRSAVAKTPPGAIPLGKTAATIEIARAIARPGARGMARGMEGLARRLTSGDAFPLFNQTAAPAASSEIPFATAPLPEPGPLANINLRQPTPSMNAAEWAQTPLPLQESPFAGNLRQPTPSGGPVQGTNLPLQEDPLVSALRQSTAAPPEIAMANPPTMESTPRPSGATAPEVNKWMNVRTSQLSHGADPGLQIVQDNLLGPTKEATLMNVDGALRNTGGKMESMFADAAQKGITIDTQDVVMDALNDATKTIGKRTDVGFQQALTNVLDDILHKHPQLDKISPAAAHSLKVDLGDAVHWNSGAMYEADLNRVLMDMYGRINGKITSAVDGIGPVQNQWGNLYQARKALRLSLLKDRVGSGTGTSPVKPPPTIKPELVRALRGGPL